MGNKDYAYSKALKITLAPYHEDDAWEYEEVIENFFEWFSYFMEMEEA